MGRGRERRDGLPHHLGAASRCQTQTRLACITLSHLQKTSTEAAARRRIVGLQSERAAKQIGGGRIFAVLRQNPCQRGENIRPLRRIGDGSLQQRACADTIVALDMREGQRDTQIHRAGRRLKPALEHGHRLVVPSASRKLIAVFKKGRHERRSSRRGSLQSIQRGIGSTGRCQGARELKFDGRIIAAPRRTFEWNHRLVRAILHHECAPENLSSKEIAAIGLQHAGGDALGFIGTLHPQCQNGFIERMLNQPRWASGMI